MSILDWKTYICITDDVVRTQQETNMGGDLPSCVTTEKGEKKMEHWEAELNVFAEQLVFLCLYKHIS